MGQLPEAAVYEICVHGYLDGRRARQLGALTFTHRPDGTTLLVGRVRDQAALYGLLSRIRDLGVPLISLRRQDPGDGMVRSG